MRLTISHTTQYHYEEPVHYGLQQLRLTPKSRAGQAVVEWKTTIEGGEKQLEYDDQHNNHVELISFDDGRSDITIHCSGVVETADNSGIVGGHGGYAPLWLFLRSTPLTRAGNNVRKLVKTASGEFSGDVERMHALTNGYTPPEGACNTFRAMLDALASFERDMHEHVHKENNVLFPRALQRECERRA